MKPELKKLLLLNLPYLLFDRRHLRRLCKPAAQPASV